MRVALLGTFYDPPRIRGGEETVMHELKAGLEARGHEVRVFTPSWPGRSFDRAPEAVENGIRRIPVPAVRFFYHFPFAGRLKPLLAAGAFDMVLNTHALLGHRLTHERHVVVAPNTSLSLARAVSVRRWKDAAEVLLRRTIACRVERGVFERCRMIVTVAPHVTEDIVRDYAIPSSKIRTVPNGIDCDRFHPAEEPRRGGAPVILYVGRVVAVKNLDCLVRAAALLHDRGEVFSLDIVGEGEERPQLERLARDLGVEGRIRWRGALEYGQLPQVYRDADIFALPSRYEGMPMVLLEAQASGLPAVVAPFPGVSGVIENGRTGVISEADRPEEFARGLARLLKDDDLRRRMGARGREVMMESYSWRRVIDRYLEAFRSLGLPC